MQQTFTIGHREHEPSVVKNVTNWELRDGALILYRVGSTVGFNLRDIIDFKAVRQP